MNVWIAVSCATLSALPCGAATPAASNNTLVLRHVNVIDMTGSAPQADMTVVIQGERIAAIGPADGLPAPPGARVIEAGGQYVIPGLWDLHTHLTLAGESALAACVDYGVLGVRDMGGDLDQLDQWRSEIGKGQRIGPQIIRAGPFVDGPKEEMEPDRAAATMWVRNEEEARQAVSDLRAKGVDFIKVHNGLSRASFFALMKEAKRQGIPVYCHLPRGVSAVEAARAGVGTLEHAETLIESEMFAPDGCAYGIDDQTAAITKAVEALRGDRGDEMLRAIAQTGTALVPTLAAYHTFIFPDGKPEDAPKIRRSMWQAMLDIVGKAQRDGVTILCGSDCGYAEMGVVPGVSLQDDLVYQVEAGLEAKDVLEAATRKTAKLLGLSKTFGTIEVGKVADLLVLDANPLLDIHNARKIRWVVLHGRPLDPKDIPASVPARPQTPPVSKSSRS